MGTLVQHVFPLSLSLSGKRGMDRGTDRQRDGERVGLIKEALQQD